MADFAAQFRELLAGGRWLLASPGGIRDSLFEFHHADGSSGDGVASHACLSPVDARVHELDFIRFRFLDAAIYFPDPNRALALTTPVEWANFTTAALAALSKMCIAKVRLRVAVTTRLC